MKYKKLILTSLLVFALCWQFCLAGESNEKAPSDIPQFSFPELIDGQSKENVSSSGLLGKPVLIDFWASWCVACYKAFPMLNELNEEYQGRLQVVGISIDKTGAKKSSKVVKKKKLQYRQLLDPENKSAELFGFSNIPQLYLYDAQGKLVMHVSGIDKDKKAQLRAKIAELFK